MHLPETIVLSLPLVVLILMHLFVGRVRFLDLEPDSPLLSAAAGTAIAYVFVYLLPKLATTQAGFGETSGGPLYTYLQHHVYILALGGFTFYFWVMWADEYARFGPPSAEQRYRPYVLAFKVVGLSAYCMQIGYLIADIQRPSLLPATVGTAVLALHFLGLDNHFRRHHQELYDRIVRWVFSAATLAGWLIGVVFQVHPTTVGLWSAFVGGGIIVTAMREEIPSEGQTRILPFVIAIVLTTVLLMVVLKIPKP